MNKELIKTYKNEFEHWLNGGNVQAFYKKDDEPKWLTDEECIEYEGHDNFSHILQNSLEPEDVLIIIEDEYIEFRGALAEGKTIQLDEAAKFSDPNRGCVDLSCKSFGSSTHLFPVNYYRIKPEEPKFKVGDWVRDKKRKHKPFMATSSDLEADSPNYVKIDCELWKPQPDEWCWYSKWDKIVCVEFYLCKYVLDMNEVEPEYKHKYEPFIGQLPTYLRK